MKSDLPSRYCDLKRDKIMSQLTSLIRVSILVILLVEDPLSPYIQNMGYIDESIAVLGLVILIFSVLRNSLILGRMWLCLGIFAACGLLGWRINSSQPAVAVFSDLFLCLKFFFAIQLGTTLASGYTEESGYLMRKIIKCCTIGHLFLLILNFRYSFFENQELRFGIPIQKLFYSHSGYLAGSQVILLIISIGLGKKFSSHTFQWLILQSLVITLTLRYKAIIATFCMILIYFVVVISKRKFSTKHAALLAICGLLLSWEQVVFYFFGEIVTARSALFSTSLIIAKDYFPFGTGFSSFGSFMSKVYYSPVYYQYDLVGIYGLADSADEVSFVSDTFWPMILGQSGVLGLVAYLVALFLLFHRINNLRSASPFVYAAGVCSFIYLLIESSSSAAFVSPLSVPLGFWLGSLIRDVSTTQAVTGADEIT